MAESKSPSATVGWDDLSEFDVVLVEDVADMSIEVGEFAVACPCCNTIISFRLRVEAETDDTETE